MIFSLTEANPLPEKAVRVGQSYFVVEYLNREEPSDEGFAERKETLRDQALSSKSVNGSFKIGSRAHVTPPQWR